ncbi:MAG: hypothetical protein MUP22_12790, partial [Desulfobacterales bacterium]|nr:hypothetical protein [Desulfobacterales bacterium]
DLEIFNEFNEKISSANTIATIPMNSFKIDDFILLSNDKGERYYVLKDHLTLYLYLDGVITSTDYIYAKLSSEFMNSFHTTDSKIFKSHYGILLDDLKLEFIEQDIVLEDHDLVSNATENIFPFISNSPLYIEDFPSFINNMSINNHQFEETTYFNDHANLSLSLNNNDDINLVKIHVNKIIADNLVMTGYSKNPENQQEPYLDPNRHIYSFFDDYTLNGTFYYENVLYWQDQAIPFKDLNIIHIEEIVTEQGISIPFIFDPITKEIKFSERYGSFLNESTILHLKGVSCELGWESDFVLNEDYWELNDFDLLTFLVNHTEWYESIYGFQYPHAYSTDLFEYYFILGYNNGSTLSTPSYTGRFDVLEATGSFGKIMPNSNGETKREFWALGKNGDFGNIMFGTTNREYRTLYFTPGYVRDSLNEDNFHVKHEYLFLHNIKEIEIYNSSDVLMGAMTLNQTTEPFPYYELVLDSKYFIEGYNLLYARIIDKADNMQIEDILIHVYKEDKYSLEQALNFG